MTLKRPPSTKFITEDQYDKMVSAFLEKPGNIAHAAQAANVMWRTAEKAWTTGWPKFNWPAIKVRLEEEKIRARARIEQETLARKQARDAELQKAQDNAVKQLKDEALIASMGRNQNVLMRNFAQGVVASVKGHAELAKQFGVIELKQMQLWLEYDAKILAQDPTAVEPHVKRPRAASFYGSVEVLKNAVSFLQGLFGNERTGAELERLYLGEPIAHVGVTVEHEPGPELLMTLEAGVAAIERAKRTGGAKVLEFRQKTLVGEEVTPADISLIGIPKAGGGENT